MCSIRPSPSRKAPNLCPTSPMFSQLRDATSLSPPKFPTRVPSMEAGLCTLAKDESLDMLKSQPCLARENGSVHSLNVKKDKLVDCYAWVIVFSEEETVKSDLADDDQDDDISCVSHLDYDPVIEEQDLLGSLGLSRWLSNECSGDSRSRDAPKTPCRTTEDV